MAIYFGTLLTPSVSSRFELGYPCPHIFVMFVVSYNIIHPVFFKMSRPDVELVTG
jgi:hypothetical protein